MKWPNTLTFIRHGESTYNSLKKKKKESSAYNEFKVLFNKLYAVAIDDKWVSAELGGLARKAWAELVLSVSDYDTPLTDEGFKQARATGEKLQELGSVPDVIYISPYLRTRQTLDGLIEGYPQLQKIEVVPEERVREQEHGLCTVYNDWRIYLTLNPEQALLHKLEEDYEYRFLNGENKADVRDRVRSIFSTFIREYTMKNVMVISHHLVLLSLRANLERWSREKFIEVDRVEKPLNCGVTVYRGDPKQGKDGKLVLDIYNQKLY